MIIAPCHCGRRRVPNAAGVLHDECAACREAAVDAARRAAFDAALATMRCPECGGPLGWIGRGRPPARCENCKRIRRRESRAQLRRQSRHP
jgi:hypothetical protein